LQHFKKALNPEITRIQSFFIFSVKLYNRTEIDLTPYIIQTVIKFDTAVMNNVSDKIGDQNGETEQHKAVHAERRLRFIP
jgi:hypothetical protein